MVEKEMSSVLLQQMRETDGYALWLRGMHEKYLRYVRTIITGNCSTAEDVAKVRASISSLRDAVELTGMSKEDVIKWMELS